MDHNHNSWLNIQIDPKHTLDVVDRKLIILHVIDGLLSTTAAYEVRRAGVLKCRSCHLERSARPHPHRGLSCQVPKTAAITLF